MDILPFAVGIAATLSVLVIVHELGHSMVAKLAGVEVEMFAIGIGPTLLSWTDSKGTIYRLNAIPLGGFAQLLDGGGREIDGSNRARSFDEAAPQWKLAITLAGPVVDGVGVILASGELVTRRRPTPRVKVAARNFGFVVGWGPLVLCIGYEIARALA